MNIQFEDATYYMVRKFQFELDFVYSVAMMKFGMAIVLNDNVYSAKRMGVCVLLPLSYLNGPMIIKEVVVSLLSNLLSHVKD